MRQLFTASKIQPLLVLAWILVFVLGLLRGGFYGKEEVVTESQWDAVALKEEKDLQTRNLSTAGKGAQTEAATIDAATPVKPSSAYENSRRKAVRDTREVWNIVQEVWKENGGKMELKSVITELERRQQAVLDDLEQLRASDGFEKWREREAKELSAGVQERLHFLQNPEDCSKARKLVCDLNDECGFGCSIHHAVYCLMVAYATERILILNSTGWIYDEKGFESVFLPLSESCTEAEVGSRSSWPGTEDTQIVELPILRLANPKPTFTQMPPDLFQRISRLHGDPTLWWVSQFLLYVLRPQPHLSGDCFLSFCGIMPPKCVKLESFGGRQGMGGLVKMHGMGEIKDLRGNRDGRYRDGQAMCLCFPHCIAITKKRPN